VGKEYQLEQIKIKIIYISKYSDSLENCLKGDYSKGDFFGEYFLFEGKIKNVDKK
jgi:hypothetical protein